MAQQTDPEQIKRTWPSEKRAAFERLMAAFWDRAGELTDTREGADLVLAFRFTHGTFHEGRFDADERFA